MLSLFRKIIKVKSQDKVMGTRGEIIILKTIEKTKETVTMKNIQVLLLEYLYGWQTSINSIFNAFGHPAQSEGVLISVNHYHVNNIN